MPDPQQQKQRPSEPAPWAEDKKPFEGGPTNPLRENDSKPNTKSILDKLRRVAPDQSKKYRQRTGQ